MSDGVNTVVLVGRLTAVPEVKAVGQSTMCRFRLALVESWQNSDGEKKTRKTFVDVEQWGRSANACGEYLKKGSQVCVEGSLALSEWESNGQKRSKLYVRARSTQFLDTRGDS